MSENFIKTFDTSTTFGSKANIRAGVMSGDDARFIRYWFEIIFDKFDDSSFSYEDSIMRMKKWFPVTRGGQYRKWYGNLEFVINLYNGGHEIEYCNSKNHRLRDKAYYFKSGITWSMITSYKISVRHVDQGILFGNGGPTCFFKENSEFYLAILNSCVSESFINMINPSLNTVISDICCIPIKGYDHIDKIEVTSNNCIVESRTDWNSFETSWDFKKHPMI